MGQNGKAITNYTRALGIEQKIGLQFDIADTLDNLGIAYIRLGRMDLAEKQYEGSDAGCGRWPRWWLAIHHRLERSRN